MICTVDSKMRGLDFSFGNPSEMVCTNGKWFSMHGLKRHLKLLDVHDFAAAFISQMYTQNKTLIIAFPVN